MALPQQAIHRICMVLAEFPAIEQATLYGSRAKGTHKPGSDIDLTLIGPQLTYDLLNEISRKLDDLLLPYMIDLSLFSHIQNPDLLAHIKRVGIVVYKKPL